MSHRVLVVDDDADMCALLATMLERLGHGSETVNSGPEALAALENEAFDLVLTDLSMDEMSGAELCQRIGESRPGLPVIIITAMGSLESALAALRSGAYDFITKPIEEALLEASITRAGGSSAMQREVTRLRLVTEKFEDIIGTSSSMRRVYDLVSRVAPNEASVLIYGETGTGKELIARALHERSPRVKGPFVALNCAAVPANLIESELFGHSRGAFTDAKETRTGMFLQASKGTIFLDEIGEMPIEVQSKLLRALQERKVRPLGATQEVAFDARIVTATNRDLEEEVREKRFREDLYYRINVVKIDLPPLRERGADILAIANHLLARATGARKLKLSTEAGERLMSYDWPGNVRELENCIERAVALAQGTEIVVDDLPEKIKIHRSDRIVVSAEDASELVTCEELERRYVYRVLKMLGGNKSRAAQVLGVDRRTLYRKLEAYEGRTPSEP